MQFIVTAYDGENKLDKRMEVRPRHLESITRVKGKVLCAGGILDDEGTMIGSMLVMDFDSREDLQGYLDQEPYILEGVWEDVRVENMNVVIFDNQKVGK